MDIKRPVRKFFSGLDNVIEYTLDHHESDLLSSLNDLRHEALEALRARTGTAEGWAWIAEYMIFHVVRRTIEKTIGSEFVGKPLNLEEWKSYVFEDPEGEFILGHGVPLKHLLDDSSDKFLRRKPDVCLLYRKRIILTVEVKTSITRPSALKKTLTTLTGIQKLGYQNPRSKAFFVTFGRTLEVRPKAVIKEYRKFYEEKGRYVGRFESRSSIQDSKLFQELDNRGCRMKLLRLEECLGKIEKLLGKLRR